MIDTGTKAGARAMERLREDRVGWLTTVTPDGQPQSSPVWFLWEDDDLVVMSLATTPRVANILANPRVAFNLNSTPGGGEVVTIEGEARIVGEPLAEETLAAYWAKYDASLADEGWSRETFRVDYPVVIRIRPTHARVW